MQNESVKKSLKKSKNVLKEKRKIFNRKICIKKTNVYNNYYELRSRAIKKTAHQYNPYARIFLGGGGLGRVDGGLMRSGGG